MSANAPNLALQRLQLALGMQDFYLSQYQQPSEGLAFETLRTLDDLFLRDLMEPTRSLSQRERLFRSLSSWGVNHALRRIVPRVPSKQAFRDFPSHEQVRAQADDFIFHCGTLELATRYEGWLRDGIFAGELRPYPVPDRGELSQILILRSVASSCSDEEIGISGLRWASELRTAEDSIVERALEERHRELEGDLERRVNLEDGWRVVYETNAEIDSYFHEWGRLYLRRIFSQDMIGSEDAIGGRPFSRYVDVLSVLSGRSQRQIAFAAIIKARHPSVHIRNLLTTHSNRESLTESIARSMDADRSEIETILNCFILNGANLDIHTASASPTWPPIVQASTDTLMLPIFGLDINPFLFLLTDLRHRFEADWFRVANKRERRWIEEISKLFDGPRWQIHGRNLRLREKGKDVTDIDFVVFERGSREIALFQLKWQHPVGFDNRGRLSSGRNLIEESNRWVKAVLSWLDRHGIDELIQRLGFEKSASPTVHLFVLGRYHVHLTGFDQRDPRAVWADWAHFLRVRTEGQGTATISQIAAMLRNTVEQSRAAKRGESLMFPIGDIAVLLNPTAVPEDSGENPDV